jgi:hypothetical protein
VGRSNFLLGFLLFLLFGTLFALGPMLRRGFSDNINGALEAGPGIKV